MLELATTETTASHLVSNKSRLDEEAGNVPALKLVTGHEGEEAPTLKSPLSHPYGTTPSCDRPSIPVGSAASGDHIFDLHLGLNPAEIRFVFPNLA